MEWTGRRVLVTGAAGVIGRVLVRDLISQGARILCVDIASGDALGSLGVEYFQADLARGVPPDVLLMQESR